MNYLLAVLFVLYLVVVSIDVKLETWKNGIHPDWFMRLEMAM